MYIVDRSIRVRLVVIPSLLVLAACAGGDTPRDTAAAAPAAMGGPNANPIDTGMSAGNHAGMNHGAKASGPAPRDSNQKTPPRQ